MNIDFGYFMNGFQEVFHLWSVDSGWGSHLFSWWIFVSEYIVFGYLLVFLAYLIVLSGYNLFFSQKRILEKSIKYGLVLFLFFSIFVIVNVFETAHLKFYIFSVGEIFIALSLIVDFGNLITDKSV